MIERNFSQLNGGDKFINPAFPNVLCIKVGNQDNRYMEMHNGNVWVIEPSTQIFFVPRD